MKTALVILNWNTRDYLRRWVPGLLASHADLWIADSASTDGSLEMLAEEFPEARVLPLDRNYGFTGGYDRAVRTILDTEHYEYIVLVNSDIDVPDGWLEPLERWMDTHPDCGVCGPKLLAMGDGFSRTDRFEYAGAAGGLLDRFGYPFCRGRVTGRTDIDRGQYDSPADVLWISGACMMTRSSLWTELGGLDDRFFAHMEEIDYCWRAQLAGWKVTTVPESRVWHLGGGTLPQDSPFKLKLNFRNNILLLDNNLASTFESQGMSRSKAARKAEARIFARQCLDLCSALVYAAGGHRDSFKAVMEARKEASELRRRPHDRPKPVRMPVGLKDICILPLAALKGDGVFKYLLNHENSHSRCR